MFQYHQYHTDLDLPNLSIDSARNLVCLFVKILRLMFSLLLLLFSPSMHYSYIWSFALIQQMSRYTSTQLISVRRVFQADGCRFMVGAVNQCFLCCIFCCCSVLTPLSIITDLILMIVLHVILECVSTSVIIEHCFLEYRTSCNILKSFWVLFNFLLCYICTICIII